MSITVEEKARLIKDYATKDNDTGSSLIGRLGLRR